MYILHTAYCIFERKKKNYLVRNYIFFGVSIKNVEYWINFNQQLVVSILLYSNIIPRFL